ncbi:YfhO family protein [bacterium]|nr:YfhO family protein [bacterium]
MLAVILPYHRLATLDGLVVTDDIGSSDIWSAEFPGRVAIGQQLKDGELPLWSEGLCGGFPMMASGGAADPLTYLLFGMLSPVAAVNYFILAVLILAATGTYFFSRRVGVSHAGALLAGVAFSYSGFMVTQLKHMAIVETICWLPWALLLLELAFGPRAVHLDQAGELRWRIRNLAGFAGIFGVQIIAGFPQSAYYCGFIYGIYAILRVWGLKQRPGIAGLGKPLGLLGAFAVACVLAIMLGAIHLLPLWELGQLSHRQSGVSFEWATRFAYWPRNALTFLAPYINGDISDLSYKGMEHMSIFWEDYGYVGLLTVLLAVLAFVRWRQFHVLFFMGTGALAYLIVLGPATPVFALAFKYIPGMGMFRFSTRFLFFVCFSLAVLGGFGLTALQEWLQRKSGKGRWRRAACWVSYALLAIVFADLVHVQMRQNPVAEADAWMEPPASAQWLQGQPGTFRIYTPNRSMYHQMAFSQAGGWEDIRPYYNLRDIIEPNTNLLWNLETADCYSGVLTNWQAVLWGTPYYAGLAQGLFARPDFSGFSAAGVRLLGLFNVQYVIAPLPVPTPGLQLVNNCSPVCIYELTEHQPRAYVAASARSVTGDDDTAAMQLVSPSFNPQREVLIHGELPQGRGGSIPGIVEGRDAARITESSAQEVVVEAASADGGFLVLADTWYPGWRAELDGQEVPVMRANVNQRAVELPPGQHTVRFFFRPSVFFWGMSISFIALGSLLLALILTRNSWRTRHTGN